jgi:hypothetical protein
LDIEYLYIAMHDVLAVEVGESLTDILKVPFDFLFGNRIHFDFVVEGAALGVFENHVGDLSLRVDVDIEELDDFGVGQAVVHHDFVFGYFVYLRDLTTTTLTATTSPLVMSLASFTCP